MERKSTKLEKLMVHARLMNELLKTLLKKTYKSEQFMVVLSIS